MKHNLKTAFFHFLDVLPSTLGYWLYHKMQRLKSNEKTVRNKITATKSSYQTVVNLLNKNGLALKGNKVAEIGSGWIPVFPYEIILNGGAAAVYTFDVNAHYSTSEIKIANDYYNLKEGSDLEKKGKYDLLKQITYFPKTDIASSNLNHVDLVISRFVLEHVSLESLKKMHNSLYENLSEGSHVLHLISPSDHRAYEDKTLSLQDFLKYSKEEWDKIQTKFDYHNRLRLPNYIEILSDKFEIVDIEYSSPDKNSRQYEMFKSLKIHGDFSKFTDVELTAGSINVLLRKSRK